MSSRTEVLLLIQTNERQRDIAKMRKEYDVVNYHQKEIDRLYSVLRVIK